MKKILILFVLLLILPVKCVADNDEASVAEAVPDSVTDIVGSIDDVTDTRSFLGRITETVRNAISADSGVIIKKAASVLLVAMFCSVFIVFGNSETPDYVSLAGCAAITMICVSDVNSYVSMGAEAISNISVFSKALLPALCTMSAASGAISASAVRYAASALFVDLFISVAEDVILPLVYSYLAVAIASSAFDNKTLGTIADILKCLSVGLMVLLATGFTVYISASSAIASGGDAVATKLTKTAISRAFPIVGSIISDAASSVVAGAELVKNTVGVFGMFTVLAVCISPLAVYGLNFIIFKAAAAGVSAMKTPRLAQVTGNIGTAFGMLVGLVGCCGLMMFISIISCMRAVTG